MPQNPVLDQLHALINGGDTPTADVVPSTEASCFVPIADASATDATASGWNLKHAGLFSEEGGVKAWMRKHFKTSIK